MFRTKSFQRRILLALLAVSLGPAALLLLLWTFGIQWIVSSVGTAGPWSSLAESGQNLLEVVDSLGIQSPELLQAAAAHEEVLSEGYRLSEFFSFLAERVLSFLPFLALALALLVAGISYVVARQLSRGFSRPIRDLVGWTEIIGRNHPLPAPGPSEARGVEEFAVLRESLRTMARELEEGRREAIQAEKLRSWTEMARRVAHELKNPLTPMRMAAENVARLEGRTAQEASAVLREEIDRLDEMARSFAQFGKMPEGPPSEVDLGELMRTLVDQHGGVEASLEINIPSRLPLVRGHYEALVRTFRNLLLNAIEAAGRDGRVKIGVAAGTDWIRVEIRDSGPGIPDEEMDRIWEPDFTTKSKGTGLGLAMVRQTIAVHQGKVEGRNHPDGGAVFSVELPVGGSS
jgi:signal transduction histidine kinase